MRAPGRLPLRALPPVLVLLGAAGAIAAGAARADGGRRAAAPAVTVPGASGAVGDTAAHTAAARCADGRALRHAFGSGAAWSLCARLDDAHGLELVELRYRAPGDRERSVLASLHLAQLLVHWHDRSAAEPRVGGGTPETRGLGGASALALTAASCDGERLALGRAGPLSPARAVGPLDGPLPPDADASPGANDPPAPADPADGTDAPARLCARERPEPLLAKYARRPALHGARWELFTVARQGLLTWRVGVALGEDGRIAPSLALSGRSGRTGADARFARTLGEIALTRATLLASWRVEPALDGETPDRVEELDFALEPLAGNRRPMSVRPIDGERFRRAERARFRVWRALDPASGAGYLLDPIDGGQAWAGPGADWTRFELAVTRARDCERHAARNGADAADPPAPTTTSATPLPPGPPGPPGPFDIAAIAAAARSPGTAHGAPDGAAEGAADGAAEGAPDNGTVREADGAGTPAEAPATASCGEGLEDFVDGEPLDGAGPVLWYARTRTWSPRREDLPLLSSVRLGFELVPFDWSAASPFEVRE